MMNLRSKVDKLIIDPVEDVRENNKFPDHLQKCYFGAKGEFYFIS